MDREQIPDEFIRQVHELLPHLFDPVRLHEHPLAGQLVSPDVTDPMARSQSLREVVLAAILDLRPPPGVPPDDPACRPYAIIHQRYADGFSREEVQRNLAISRRQFFREQQRALDALTRVLWQRRIASLGTGPSGAAADEELEHLHIQHRAFDIEASARQAISAVRGLADSRGVALSLSTAGVPLAYGDEAVTRQLIVGVLSLLAQGYGQRYLEVAFERHENALRLHFRGVLPGADIEQLGAAVASLRRLATRTDASLTLSDTGQAIILSLPLAPARVVVVVDDNARTLQLFQRYLEPYRYQVVAISSGAQALGRIAELRPHAVILDVMMQDVDGWQVLQGIRTDPHTETTPVIVCSVLNEAELARSLGADLYLRKPISQLELVRALGQVDRGPDSGPVGDREPPPATA